MHLDIQVSTETRNAPYMTNADTVFKIVVLIDSQGNFQHTQNDNQPCVQSSNLLHQPHVCHAQKAITRPRHSKTRLYPQSPSELLENYCLFGTESCSAFFDTGAAINLVKSRSLTRLQTTQKQSHSLNLQTRIYAVLMVQ